MKNKASWYRHLRLGLRLNVMFFLLMIVYMIVYTPSASSPLALSAESEPMVSLPGGVGPQASELLAGATPAKADMLLHLRIYLQLRDKQAAEKMNQDLHNGASPNYHKWLKTGQFDEMFGPLQTSYDAISAWLTSQGFTVNAVRRDRRDLEFTGTVAQADQAFQVQIMSMSDGKHYGILSDPVIPTRFQGVILGVIGLDNLGGVSPASTASRRLPDASWKSAFAWRPSDCPRFLVFQAEGRAVFGILQASFASHHLKESESAVQPNAFHLWSHTPILPAPANPVF